ncbi:MAG: NAD(P)/FAD-dependent oxidoreductase [Gemmatimonadales bacterium]|nr:MAG: NAD(P)/FAD-dependent oxidoreductase [Gemmatimonadales bacterium]
MGGAGLDYDLIVIGAGHNALVAAAYAAAAGRRVCVVERRRSVGGAVSTAEIVPGYRFDLGGSAHILIRLTPIVEELELEKHGLEYLDVDPLFFAPFEDGQALFFHRDEERTAAGLEAQFPGEGEAYLRFLDAWRPFARTVRDAFLAVPSPWELGKKFVFRRSGSDWKKMLQHIFRPYGEIVDEYFTEERVKTPLVWMAAQSGPPPTEPLSAPFLLWHPLYHEGGIARPRGGSGALSQALARKILSHGGTIHTGTPVTRILMEGDRAVGVEIAAVDSGNRPRPDDDSRFRTTPGADGWAAPSAAEIADAPRETITARAVLSGTHALETLTRLLPEEHRPPGADGMRVGNGFGAILRLALDGPIRYTAHPGPEARIPLQLLCRDRRQIQTAYGDFLRGEPSRDPPIVAMSFSAVDDTLAPPGHEVLWLWAQYYPCELASGSWDQIAEREADRILDTFERYAPGTRDRVVGSLFQHPRWLERELSLPGGNVMHLEMGMDQMFALRPLLGMSGYRSHRKGLYLTGASTHPGGGIMGASGRNAARVVLKDLDRKRV